MADGTLRISVAMTTYQGAKFLGEQLASILAQTQLPDEIVIGDDASTDGTWPILQEFAQSSPIPRTPDIAVGFGRVILV